jgi:hypothetical protein
LTPAREPWKRLGLHRAARRSQLENTQIFNSRNYEMVGRVARKVWLKSKCGSKNSGPRDKQKQTLNGAK